VAVVGAGTHERSRRVDRDWSVPRFLFVGFDWQRKNGPRVLEAFERVRVSHPQATLDLVGGHPEVSSPGVTGHGILRRDVAEDRDTLKSLFDRSTCFVMPSVFEPAGVVFTEAAAAGLPSVAGTNGGSVDFVGEGGIMVDPQSGDQLLGAMLSLANADAAQRVGALAADRSQLFTWPAVAARILRGLGLTPPEGRAQDYLPFRGEDGHSLA
jgi:glycosyltransferase involved in cell wall biosynthesis